MPLRPFANCVIFVVIGDYFQWAASYAGYGITAEASKVPTNLVIYTSFTTKYSGGESDAYTFKDSKTFVKDSSPYGGTSYTKYNNGDKSTRPILEQSDDVVNIVLGSTWRMSTGEDAGDFTKMRASTYWAWDGTDKGYYVFKPEVGTSGTANGRGNIAETDDKTKALLFFPAAGRGSFGETLDSAGSIGFYWSSTLYIGSADFANCLYFYSSSVDPKEFLSRNNGFPVRPVSD